MNNKHRKTLLKIFQSPIQSGIIWSEIELMLKAFGAEIEERAGSRIVISLNRVISVFHRPHPQKETDKGAIKSIRLFLQNAGIKP